MAVSEASRSYAKSTVAMLAVVTLGSFGAWLSLHHLPRAVRVALALLYLLVALVGAVLAAAGLLVLARHRRGSRGGRDLFLDLNRSREAAALRASGGHPAGGVRRWLARRMLGHDLLVGDLVVVRSWAEIRATLDERGCLRELPFMPEMLAMCGRRAQVFRCAHRLFDYRKTRRMRHLDDALLLSAAVCDGSGHGECNAACHTIWRSAWLRRIGPEDEPCAPDTGAHPVAEQIPAVLAFGTSPPRYACQLTQLSAASRSVGNRSVINFLRPLISGNVAPAAFAVGWLTHLFNELQQRRGGIGFPAFEAHAEGDAARPQDRLTAGDCVVVRSSGEIRATLNDRLEHRGMGFDADMLKHCGHRYRVQAEIRQVIDIVSGEMRTMKTPAYRLSDVHFSGERQLFNAQYEPLFWRAGWLHRVDCPPGTPCRDESADVG